MFYYYCILFFVMIVKLSADTPMPSHCTEVTKETNLMTAYKLDYGVSYLAPGQRDGYVPMYCLNPPAVAKAYAKVCDWFAAPQVSFTLGDDYLRIVRQDPSEKYLGTATVTIYQNCGHAASTTGYTNAVQSTTIAPTRMPEVMCRVFTKLECVAK